MRLYRLGDSGRPVLDIQERLAALDYRCDPDESGVFGPVTNEAVVAFQQGRGLPGDGIVGPDTWRALVEAGYRLGDRLLYLRRPMLRGDDVEELQTQLNALGFDAGKVDGIFGPDTQAAVLDFQRNRGMAEDLIVGPEVINELRGIVRATRKAGRAEVREREWLRRLPSSLVGSRIFLDPACSSAAEAVSAWEAANAAASLIQTSGGVPVISRSSDARFPPRIRAQRANRIGADLVISFELPRDDHEGAYYFASTRSHSEAGEALAQTIAAQLGVEAEGRAPVMLKETRAPAVIVCVGDLGRTTGRRVVAGLSRFFETDYRAASPASGVT